MPDTAVLSQREIDALLSAEMAQEEQGASAIGRPGSRDARRRIKPYDFRHPEKLSKEQLRGLQIIQQGVASSLAQALSARLRAPVVARLSALERGIYEEYVAQIGTSAVVIVLDMNPLNGYAVAAFGVDVAFAIIDRLLGGRGRKSAKNLARDLTDIEVTLTRHIGMDIARSLIEPWGRVTPLEPDVTELAMGPQVMHAIPPSEFVITAWYEVQFGEQTGGISLCFPLPVVDQVLPKLSGQTMFENRRTDLVPSDRVADEQILPMMVPVKATLGSARIPAIDLANLQEGDVIVLDRLVSDPLRVHIGNCEKLAGSPGMRGKKLALQVTGAVDEDGYVQLFEEQSA